MRAPIAVRLGAGMIIDRVVIDRTINQCMSSRHMIIYVTTVHPDIGHMTMDDVIIDHTIVGHVTSHHLIIGCISSGHMALDHTRSARMIIDHTDSGRTAI